MADLGVELQTIYDSEINLQIIWPGTLDDVRAATLHLPKIAAERSLDLKRVVANGHSAGGQLALWLAKQKALAPRGVAPLAAVSDLRRAWE